MSRIESCDLKLSKIFKYLCSMAMGCKGFKVILIGAISILSSSLFCHAQQDPQDLNQQHLNVIMRMIGDNVLLSLGDSTSRVLPIEMDSNRCKIQFESQFEFSPEDLVRTINRVVTETDAATRYLVEVEQCGSKKVVYSYEMGNANKPEMIPCKSRNQPKDCYILFITLMDSASQSASAYLPEPNPAQKKLSGDKAELIDVNKSNESVFLRAAVIALSLIIILGIFLYFRKQRSASRVDSEMIPLGKYRFDKNGMMLSFENEKTELSGKETELLYLLCTSENKTLDRDYILNVVWGDEGDYVGRTLDVFISKLRKKLDSDSRLKIVNVRGVGYKFVMEQSA